MKIRFLIICVVLGYSWALAGCETFTENIFPPKKAMKAAMEAETPKTESMAKQEKSQQKEAMEAAQTKASEEKMNTSPAKTGPSKTISSAVVASDSTSPQAISQAPKASRSDAAAETLDPQKDPSKRVPRLSIRKATERETAPSPPEIKKQAIVKAPETKPMRETIPELGTVYFEFDQSRIRGHFKAILEKNLEWLKKNPHVKIQLEGHADERGTNEYNLALGVRRGKSILNYLISLGANPRQFSIISFGEERPLNQNCKVEDCYEKNRRVEFTRQ